MRTDDDAPSELERELAGRPEDKPAPLFVRKESASNEEADAEHSQDIDQSVVTLQGQEASDTDGEGAPYETEQDGKPVVGDLLKIQFVDHQVVPTILVGTCSNLCYSNSRQGPLRPKLT